MVNVQMRIVKSIHFRALFISLVLFFAAAAFPLRAFSAEPSVTEGTRDVLSGASAPGADVPRADEVGDHRLNVEEVDDRIIITWSGPKAGELLSKKIKARGTTVSEFVVYKSANPDQNFVPTARILPNSSGGYVYEDFVVKSAGVFYYRITFVDSDGAESPYIRQFSASAKDIHRPAPPKITETVSGEGFVRISWRPYKGDDFREYQVLRSEEMNNDFEIVARISQASTIQFVDSDVVNGRTYYYCMRIKDAGENISRRTPEVVGKPRDQKPPEIPKNPKAEPRNNAVLFSWERCADNDVEQYRIRMHEGEIGGGSKFKQIAAVAARDMFLNAYEAKGLKNGRVYYFTVSAVDFSGNESGQSFEAKGVPVDFTPPDAPGHIRVTALNGANRVEWTQVFDSENDLAGYRIYRKSSAFPKFIMIADLSKPKESSDLIVKRRGRNRNPSEFYPTTYMYDDNGLYNGMTYFYYVVACDRKGNESKPTDTADGTPRDRTPPEKVQGLKAVSNIGSVSLRWQKNRERDLNGYFIYRRCEGENGYSLICEIKDLSNTSYTDAHLKPGVKTSYRVAAFDESRNESVASDEAVAKSRMGNQVSFSRAFIDNRPNTFCYSFNPNDLSVSYTSSVDNISWKPWSEKAALPSAPPNFGRMASVNIQKWNRGYLVFCYNPETLDLYFTSTADEKAFGSWQMLFDRIELPPNFGKYSSISFEKDEKSMWAFAYNPRTASSYYSQSRDLEKFLRWTPCGLKMPAPPLADDSVRFSMTFDEKGFYIFAFDLSKAELRQTMSFDRKHWKAWYSFAKNIKKPVNLEKDR